MTPSAKILRALIIAQEEVRLKSDLAEMDKAVGLECLNYAQELLEQQGFCGDIETRVLFSDYNETDAKKVQLYATKINALMCDKKFRTLGAFVKNSPKEIVAELTLRNLDFPPALRAFYEVYHELTEETRTAK